MDWTREEIEAEQAVQAKSTPGEWASDGRQVFVLPAIPVICECTGAQEYDGDEHDYDAEAIVAAHANYPRALLALAKAKDRIVELESALKDVIGVVRRSPVQFPAERDRVLTELAEYALAGVRT